MVLSFLCGELSYGTSPDKCMVFWSWLPHLKPKFHLIIIYYSVIKVFCIYCSQSAQTIGPKDFRHSRHAIRSGCRCVSSAGEEGRGRCADLQVFLSIIHAMSVLMLLTGCSNGLAIGAILKRMLYRLYGLCVFAVSAGQVQKSEILV